MGDNKEIQRMLNAQKEMEAQYRALFDRSIFCVYVHDLEGRFLDANQATLKTLGYTMEELCGLKFSNLISREQYALATEVMDEIMKSGQQEGVSVFTVKKKDGSSIIIETNGFLIVHDGNPYAIQGMARDITSRIRTEEALLESEKKYRDIFERVSDFLYIHDLEGRFMQANQSVINVLGYTPEELMKLSVPDLMPEKYKALFSFYIQQMLQDGSNEGLISLMTKSGKEKVVEFKNTVIRDSAGNPLYVQGSGRDMTERLKAEKALKLSTEKFINLLDNIQEAYFEVDLTGNFTFFNKVAPEYLGFTDQELMGMNYRKYMDEANAGKVFEAFHQVYMSGKPAKAFEWEMKDKDGRVRHVEASIAPLRGPRGDITGFQGIVRDITAEIEADKEKDRYEIRLIQAQKMEAIGALASGVAHDFNNMLAGILGYGELVKRNLPEGSRLLAYCEQIITAGLRARELVQQILSFSRIYKAQREPIPIYPIVQEAIKLLRATIPTYIEIQSPADMPDDLVYCDPTEIHQIVMNLCTNAYQAMESGGMLGVELRKTTPEDAPASGLPGIRAGSHLVLIISDTGCGMDDETRKHIFDPFFTTKEQGKGTGLGLATVQRIVSALRGEIVVSSEVDKGTTFSIYLPCHQEVKGTPAS